MLNRNLSARAKLFFEYSISSWIRDSWRLAGKSQVISFSHDVARTEIRSGLFYSPLSDALLEEFAHRGLSVQSFALWGSTLTGKNSWLHPFSTNRAMTFAWFRSVAHRLLVHGELVFSNSGIFQQRVFEEILLKTGAKIVISLMPSIDLARACRSKKVALVEVIHGFGYRELAEPHKRAGHDSLPHVFLARDPVTAKTYDSLKARGCSIIATLPFLALERGLQMGGEPSTRNSGRQKSTKSPKVVLVAVSHGGELDQPSFDFKSFFKLFRSTDGLVSWRIRLHPVQAKSLRFASFRRQMDSLVGENPNTEWRTATSMSGRDAILGSNVVVTHFSEIVYDAAFLGRKSAVLWEKPRNLKLEQFRYFPELEKAGLIQFFDFEDKNLVDWLLQQKEIVPWTASSQTPLDLRETVARIVRMKEAKPWL